MGYDKLTVMADFCSSGIWAKEDSLMIHHESLNLPDDLIKEFEDWIEFYDRDCHSTRHYHFKPEMADELNRRGRELAKKLKKIVPYVKVYYRGEIDGDMLPHEEITGA